MPQRPCLTCGTLTTTGPRCPGHTNQVAAARTQAKRQRRPYTNTEKTRRATAVGAWRQQWGDICPGWGIPAHPSQDLTADHIHPYAAGGPETGPLTILCRSCNARRGTTTTPPPPTT